MKRLLPFILFSLSANAFAVRSLSCGASFNSDSLFEADVLVKEKERKLFGELAGLEFFVTDKGQNRIELEVFNKYEPSRSYAESTFSGEGSFVNLVIWRQDYLLEVRCSQVSMTKSP